MCFRFECRAQEQFDSRQAERQEMLSAITARQEEMQVLAQEKGQLQTVLDTCAAELKVRSGDHNRRTGDHQLTVVGEFKTG
jgi:hypothetical protein